MGKPKVQFGGYCNHLSALVGGSERKPWAVADAGHVLVEVPGLGDGLGVTYRRRVGLVGDPGVLA